MNGPNDQGRSSLGISGRKQSLLRIDQVRACFGLCGMARAQRQSEGIADIRLHAGKAGCDDDQVSLALARAAFDDMHALRIKAQIDRFDRMQYAIFAQKALDVV